MNIPPGLCKLHEHSRENRLSEGDSILPLRRNQEGFLGCVEKYSLTRNQARKHFRADNEQQHGEDFFQPGDRQAVGQTGAERRRDETGSGDADKGRQVDESGAIDR